MFGRRCGSGPGSTTQGAGAAENDGAAAGMAGPRLTHLHPSPPPPKAGVNVSVVYGSMPPEAYRAASTNPDIMKKVKDSGDTRWGAAGLIVLIVLAGLLALATRS
jgi:hypothetical protein